MTSFLDILKLSPLHLFTLPWSPTRPSKRRSVQRRTGSANGCSPERHFPVVQLGHKLNHFQSPNIIADDSGRMWVIESPHCCFSLAAWIGICMKHGEDDHHTCKWKQTYLTTHAYVSEFRQLNLFVRTYSWGLVWLIDLQWELCSCAYVYV